MSESHHPNYKKIYYVLLVLLVISVAGPFLGIKWVTLLTAFGIALVKARLVIANFMHLKWEKNVMKIMLTASLVLVALFFAAVAPDIMKHSGTNWVNDAAQAATARGIPAPHEDGEAKAEPAGEHGTAATAAATETPPVAAAPAFDAPGQFRLICSSCHGQGGAGDGAAGAALTPKPANFTSAAFWAGKTDANLVKAIREGGASVGRSASMPPWGSMYNEDQARQLVAYLKTLRH